MATLQDLKTEYQKQVDAWREESAAKEADRQAKQEEILNDLRPRVIAYIANKEGVDGAELEKFGTLTGNWDTWSEEPKLNDTTFTLELPKHQPVILHFYFDGKGGFHQNNKHWIIEYCHDHFEALGPTLIAAANAWQRNEEARQREAANEQAYQERMAAEKQQKQQDQDELRIMIEQVTTDPTAVLLLKLFAAVQQERTDLTERINNLQELAESSEYFHEAELSRAKESARRHEREAQEAQDNARSLEYRVDDLEKDLSKAKRQRTW